MATYYRWRKSTIGYSETSLSNYAPTFNTTTIYYTKGSRPSNNTGEYTFQNTTTLEDDQSFTIQPGDYFGLSNPATIMYGTSWQSATLYSDGTRLVLGSDNLLLQEFTIVVVAGETIGYVYSTNASSYPNGGVSGSYYYDQRTTITSPTAPTNIQHPNPITTPTVTVSWDAATSSVPSYSVSKYELSYALNGSGTWKTAGTPSGTSLEVTVPTEATSIQFRVRAQDSNGKWSSYTTGTVSNVLQAPTITAPSIAMQNQPITINWTEVDTATSYILQRKANTDADWVEVYTGSDLEFTEEVGTWSTVQYRVQATFSSGPGGWGTSKVVPVVSASALVISGQDGDLGTLVNDVPYSVSSDTGNQIALELRVNGALWTALEVSSGYAQSIPVIDLPTGAGTIDILATVQASTGAVSAARAWTYTKTPVTTSAGPCDVVEWQDATGAVKFPVTLAEAVRIPGGMTLDQVIQFPAQICTGSYVGTGTYGKDNPNTITLPFNAEIIWIGYAFNSTNAPTSAQRGAFSFMRGSSHGLSYIANQSSMSAIKISFEENTCSWFANTAIDQLNLADTTYRYVALGAFMDGDDE